MEKTHKILIFPLWKRDTSVVLMKSYISSFQRKSTTPEQESSELLLMWWTEVINKNCLPSRIIFSEHTPCFCFPHARCAMHKVRGWHGSNPTHQMSGGGGGREGTTRAILCPQSPNVEGFSTTNQHGHSHQNTDQPNSRGDGCGRVWPQGSSYWYFSSFQPFLAQGFPKTDVVSMHLFCMNFFSDCWSPHQFFGTCIHSWSRHCGCPTSTGLKGEMHLV